MKNKIIKIRAHHLACIPRFYHGGYDEKFANNIKEICASIRKNPEIKIKVISSKFDDLCVMCPYRGKKNCIQSAKIGKWIIKQDEKVLKYLKIKRNDIYSAKKIFNLSIEKINSDTIKSICKNCIFLENCIKVDVNKSFWKEINK